MCASIPDPAAPACGGIDLGGTKIEATLFAGDLTALSTRRIATPQGSYAALRDVLVQEVQWLRTQANQPKLPVGIGVPGLVDPQTGISFTANLSAKGHTLASDLIAISGGQIAVANDCKCFALSEANGGAGQESERVFGLILGTGLGGGFCRKGQLDLGFNGLVGEVGHFGLPAHLIAKHKLPLWRCGCGRTGCFETLISGPGLSRLAKHLTGTEATSETISRDAATGDRDMNDVLNVWSTFAAELLHTIQLHLDPDCIVLGGGLSKISGLDEKLQEKLAKAVLPSVRIPKILKPIFGDSSGGRGAALLVLPK